MPAEFPDAQTVDTANKHDLPEVSFSEKNFTLLLKIDKASVDMTRLMNQVSEYDEKPELHMTVIGFKNGREINKALKMLDPGEKKVKIEAIQGLIGRTDWSFKSTGKIYKISKEYWEPGPDNKGRVLIETRRSIIERVELPSIATFYSELNALLRTDLKEPPPHITLYTTGTDRDKAKEGIGLNSVKELEDLNPELISE